MAQPVRVLRLTEHEGRKLQQIVRRGSSNSVRFRRVMMLLASAGGSTVPVIARLVQADEDTCAADLPSPRFWPTLTAGSRLRLTLRTPAPPTRPRRRTRDRG